MRASSFTPLALSVLVVAACIFPVASAQEQGAMKMSVVKQTAEWKQLQALVGEWEGVTEFDGQKMPIHVEMRLTGDGSALMHVQGRGTPYEMVTMFHPDGDRLIATHYCAAHNQPRMLLAKGSAPTQLTFEFLDGTNIAPGDGYMKRLVITVKDADHHDETWTSLAGGKETPPHVFSYSRKK